jgi:hypothetical protein
VITRRGILAGFAVAMTPIGAIASAQEYKAGKLHRVGVLTGPTSTANVEALRQGLRDLGYREGTDLVILQQNAEGRFDRLDAAVAPNQCRLPDEPLPPSRSS